MTLPADQCPLCDRRLRNEMSCHRHVIAEHGTLAFLRWAQGRGVDGEVVEPVMPDPDTLPLAVMPASGSMVVTALPPGGLLIETAEKAADRRQAGDLAIPADLGGLHPIIGTPVVGAARVHEHDGPDAVVGHASKPGEKLLAEQAHDLKPGHCIAVGRDRPVVAWQHDGVVYSNDDQLYDLRGMTVWRLT